MRVGSCAVCSISWMSLSRGPSDRVALSVGAGQKQHLAARFVWKTLEGLGQMPWVRVVVPVAWLVLAGLFLVLVGCLGGCAIGHPNL